MKLKLIVAVLLPFLFQTCKKEEPTAYVPAIEAISFNGLAQEDIQLDAVNRVITLMMPAIVTDFKLKPTLQLTPNTKIISGLLPEGTLDFSTYCPCQDNNPKITVGSTITNQLTITYQVRLKVKEPLIIKPSTTPLTYSISDKSVHNVVVPVENYYGSYSIRRFTITNIDTGKSAYTSGDGSCLNDCSLVGLNRMAIHLDFFLRNFDYGFGPGSYTVEFTLTDGTIVKTPQRIQIVP